MAAPPYDSGACGNPYELRNETFWGRRSFRLLPESYWNSKCDETPAIDLVLDFMNLRHDRNGEPLSKKLGPVEKHPDGWWRLPIVSARKSFRGQWSTAWHAHSHLVEQLQESNIRSNLRGVMRFRSLHCLSNWQQRPRSGQTKIHWFAFATAVERQFQRAVSA